jgi:hypothetical protein
MRHGAGGIVLLKEAKGNKGGYREDLAFIHDA